MEKSLNGIIHKLSLRECLDSESFGLNKQEKAGIIATKTCSILYRAIDTLLPHRWSPQGKVVASSNELSKLLAELFDSNSTYLDISVL